MSKAGKAGPGGRPHRDVTGDAPREFFRYTFGNKYDWENDHLKDTPKRFVKMLTELTTPEEFTFTTFPAERNDEMIVSKNIPFTSLCAHHVVPFMGVAHVAYIPRGQIVGLSKLARTVKYYAAGLQVQEALTTDIADRIDRELEPLGVAVYLEAEHLCMTIRGVQSPGTTTVTSVMRGVFGDHTRLARQEFLSAIKG